MKQRILIIDDESDFCLIMKKFFEKKDYEARSASTIKEGLEIVKTFKPDILFLDNNLPDGNGWDVVDEIVEIIPQIKTYLISAHRNKSTITLADDNVVIWEKPISLSTLNVEF